MSSGFVSSLEVLACYIAAVVHDVEHPGAHPFNTVETHVIYPDKAANELPCGCPAILDRNLSSPAVHAAEQVS